MNGGASNVVEKYLFESPTDLSAWLQAQYVEASTCQLFEDHGLDGFTFTLLTESDLREMGISRMGVRKRLLFLISLWRKQHSSLAVCDLPYLPSTTSFASGSSSDSSLSPHTASGRRRRKPSTSPAHAFCESDPKVWKVILSAVYAFLVLGLTSFVMVLAHERLPEISKYPPLPDILLDNLPYIPWAFEAAELVALCLCIIWIGVLIFHKHRHILFRRYCSLLGTVFLLRSVTMIITSLSVPGRHLSTECQPFLMNSYKERFQRAAEIWFRMGMTLRGVRTCGDYMFSGHTTVITLFNFFITEYTPPSFHPLHTFTWVLNIFGIFFILAAHEHYSIDVFIAVYITTRLFLYYHWQANNNHLTSRPGSGDRVTHQRGQIWFPLFCFFEAEMQGAVPHEYSNPLRDLAMAFAKLRARPRLVGGFVGRVWTMTSLILTSTTTNSSATVANAAPNHEKES